MLVKQNSHNEGQIWFWTVAYTNFKTLMGISIAFIIIAIRKMSLMLRDLEQFLFIKVDNLEMVWILLPNVRC